VYTSLVIRFTFTSSSAVWWYTIKFFVDRGPWTKVECIRRKMATAKCSEVSTCFDVYGKTRTPREPVKRKINFCQPARCLYSLKSRRTNRPSKTKKRARCSVAILRFLSDGRPPLSRTHLSRCVCILFADVSRDRRRGDTTPFASYNRADDTYNLYKLLLADIA